MMVSVWAPWAAWIQVDALLPIGTHVCLVVSRFGQELGYQDHWTMGSVRMKLKW